MAGRVHAGRVIAEILLESFGVIDAHHRIGQRGGESGLGCLGFQDGYLSGSIEIGSIEAFGIDVADVGFKRIRACAESFLGVELVNTVPGLLIGIVAF